MTRMSTDQVLQLAMQHYQGGRFAEAEQLYRAIIAHDPRQADALHMLGGLAYQANYNEESVKFISQAIALRPQWAEAHTNLGNALKRLGKTMEAAAAYKRALELRGDLTHALLNLGNLALEAGHFLDAEAYYQKVIKLDRTMMEAYNNLGNVLKGTGRLEEAGIAYQKALELAPELPEVRVNLGSVLQDLGRLDDAEGQYREALRRQNDYAGAYHNLGNVLIEKGQIPEGLACYSQALALNPALPAVHSNILLGLHYDAKYSPEVIFAEIQRWAQIHAAPLQGGRGIEVQDRSPERRLRVGYISGDFWTHSCAYFSHPLLAHHDHQKIEVFCYAESLRKDAMTAAISASADHWLDTSTLPDAALAARIRKDQIDILVDLTGHAGKNRLLMFAQRAAPVQVTYLGFPNSTGLATMDYRLTDAWADPPGITDPWHTEKLVRLPGAFLCYEPPANAPHISDLPALASGSVTLGSFNNVLKVSPLTVAMWSAILKQLPTARLSLKSFYLSVNVGEVSPVQRRLLALFAENGIGPERLELQGKITGVENHLAQYQRVDIGLDPYPYHGTTTTCEALWMGVPVVTLAGRAHVSRVGASLLTNVGLPELVAQTPEEYVEKVVALAGDLPRLAALRAGLRQRMNESVLTDAPGFARKVEDAYREMWRQWCAAERG